MENPILGGLTAQQFLAGYWQKRPLLVRNAIPGFAGLLERDALFSLARNEEVESRLVECPREGWQMRHGPLRLRDLRPRRHPWTVLVQGLNLHLPEADRLLHRFDFIPHARLDDVMVSYATDGGSVGPHVDSYDVFLLQGSGKRRWRISGQRDLDLVEAAPLKILRDFRPSKEWLLEAGDMLYLPPHYAHHGIAMGECTTYSIGFRAPSAQELMTHFLDWLRDQILIDGMYRDPDLKLQTHPAEISKAMLEQVQTMIAKLRWDEAMVRDFLGCYLTEPKAQVYFETPQRRISRARFITHSAKTGLRLDAGARLLFTAGHFYLNGEAVKIGAVDRRAMRLLADRRKLDNLSLLSEESVDLLYDWYLRGCCHLATE